MKLTREDVKKYGTEDEKKFLKEEFSEVKSLLIRISTDLNSVSTETHWARELSHKQERKIDLLANQARELVKKAIKVCEEQ